MYKSTLFTILFYLGCANELAIWNPELHEISKHRKNKLVKRQWDSRITH